MRTRTLAVTCLLATGLLVTGQPANADDCSGIEQLPSMGPDSQVRIPANCATKDSTVVVAGIPIEIPPADEGRGVSNHMDGTTTGVSAVTLENEGGYLTATTQLAGEPPVQEMAPAGPPAACADPGRAWSGKRNNGYEYYISSAGVPSGITYTVFRDEIYFAHNTIDTGRNDCGLGTGGLGINITHKGATSLRAMRTDGSCFGDSYDVIDFGALPSGVIGRACTRWTIVPYADDRIFESDVRLKSTIGWFRTIPSGCSGRYEMAGVLTHEFGHVFGMAHVSESSHGFLTMSTIATPCSYVDNTWGRGDYDNLHVHY